MYDAVFIFEDWNDDRLIGESSHIVARHVV